MYLIPGYVTYCKDGDAIVITSNLFHNKVKVTDLEYQKEFSHVIENGGCEKLATPLTKFLHEQELLATEGEIRCALNEAKTLLNKTLMITIMPTEGCNFRCPYCYEDHTPYTMTRKMLDRLEEFITEKASQFPVVRISWFGGEPTLCKDTVVEVSELVQSLAKKYHFEFASSMTTNGYLLNLDYFRQLYKGGIRCFQITLDGWDHDKSRPHVSGQGTLHQILDNLTALSALPQDLFDFRVIIRHNILEGDMDFSWYDHLYKLFGSDPRFMVAVRTANDWGR